jgi:hypothetical protein
VAQRTSRPLFITIVVNQIVAEPVIVIVVLVIVMVAEVVTSRSTTGGVQSRIIGPPPARASAQNLRQTGLIAVISSTHPSSSAPDRHSPAEPRRLIQVWRCRPTPGSVVHGLIPVSESRTNRQGRCQGGTDASTNAQRAVLGCHGGRVPDGCTSGCR